MFLSPAINLEVEVTDLVFLPKHEIGVRSEAQLPFVPGDRDPEPDSLSLLPRQELSVGRVS